MGLTHDNAKLVLGYLREQRSGMVELLQRLALAESPSGDPAATAQALALLAPELERSGLEVCRLAGQVSGGLLQGGTRRRLKQPQQMLVGHCDTVWPVGTVERMPVRIEGDALLGPGVLDMKGGLVQMVFALRALHDLGLEPAADCVAVVTTDEEIGSPDSTPVMRGLAAQAVRAFVLEPAFGREGKLKTARKAVGDFTVTITGRAAHAGLAPQEGVSAILELSHVIQKLFALNDATRGITVNVGTVDGGLRPNVVAPQVKACVDVRVWSAEDAAAVESAIRGLQPINPQTLIRVEGGFAFPPLEPSPRNQALWHLARDLGKQLGLELEQAAVGGASDGNTTSQLTATLDGLGAVGDGAHAEHEHVLIPHMVSRCALLALLLLAPLSSDPAVPPEVMLP